MNGKGAIPTVSARALEGRHAPFMGAKKTCHARTDCSELRRLEGRRTGEQQSAEAIVAIAQGGEGLNVRSRTGAERSDA
jgi:hypothetical protein